jgi:hypothetical protein
MSQSNLQLLALQHVITALSGGVIKGHGRESTEVGFKINMFMIRTLFNDADSGSDCRSE